MLWLTLPESVRFLVLKNAPAEQITAVLHKIAPEADLSGATYTGVAKPKGSPVRQLFQPGLVSGTLLIWLSFFMSLLVFYLLSSWLPTVISSAGMTLKEASLMSMMLQLGGTAGALLIGALMDRINPHTVLGSFYALAALFIALIGSSTASPWLLSLAVFGTGFCLAGSQVGVNALAAGFYPTASRATGVAWANAVGRSGSVLGSMFGGAILASGLGLPVAFAIVGIPAVIAGLSMFLKGRLAPQPVHHTAPGASRRTRHRESRFAALRQQPESGAGRLPAARHHRASNQKMEENHEASRHHRRDHRIGSAQEGQSGTAGNRVRADRVHP